MTKIPDKRVGCWMTRAAIPWAALSVLAYKRGPVSLRLESIWKIPVGAFPQIFSWLPALLVNPASFSVLALAGTLSLLMPWLKKAWQLVQIN